MSVAQVLNRYTFQKLVPGQNDEHHPFKGGGVCVIAVDTSTSGEWAIVDSIAADDLLPVARSLLKQRNRAEEGHFALLLPVPKPDRAAVVEELKPHYRTGRPG